jgi:hypothetical protein
MIAEADRLQRLPIYTRFQYAASAIQVEVRVGQEISSF